MNHYKASVLLLIAKIAAVSAFAPQFSIDFGAAQDTIAPGLDTSIVGSISDSLITGADSLLLSVVEEGEAVTKQGLINWDNPGEAILGSITLLYIVFSIAAGIKYVVVDGYRPKM